MLYAGIRRPPGWATKMPSARGGRVRERRGNVAGFVARNKTPQRRIASRGNNCGSALDTSPACGLHCRHHATSSYPEDDRTPPITRAAHPRHATAKPSGVSGPHSHTAATNPLVGKHTSRPLASAAHSRTVPCRQPRPPPHPPSHKPTRRSHAPRVGQVVNDGDGVPGGDQLHHGVAADVARAARDEDASARLRHATRGWFFFGVCLASAIRAGKSETPTRRCVTRPARSP